MRHQALAAALRADLAHLEAADLLTPLPRAMGSSACLTVEALAVHGAMNSLASVGLYLILNRPEKAQKAFDDALLFIEPLIASGLFLQTKDVLRVRRAA